MEEINDFYDMKNEIGNLIIQHHYSFNSENVSDSRKVQILYEKIFKELDRYREKHANKEVI